MKTAPMALVVALALLVPARWLRAQPQDAESTAAQFFRAGLAAYERHEYRAAALAFEEAFRRAPRGAAMYNAGRGWEAAGDKARAADAFAVALGRGDLESGDAAYAREHLADLEPSLGVVDVEGPSSAAVALDGTERGALPRKLHLVPGHHELRVRRRDASVVEKSVDAAAGAVAHVTVEDAPALPSPAPPVAPPPPERHGPPTWAYVSLGVGGALAAAGAVTYVKFADDRSTFDSGGDHDASLHSSALTLRTVTYVLWGAAGACVIAGAVAFLASRSGGEKAASALRVGPGWLAGTF
jgi:hypothetical protein